MVPEPGGSGGPPRFGRSVNPIPIGEGRLPPPITTITPNSDAASGWAGWALAHPEFGSSFNPITTSGADYAHLITASPPGFENAAVSLRHAI